MKKLHFIAHRGLSSNNCPDNSYLSVKNAINNHFSFIELDIQTSSDNQIVIYHDLFINNLLVHDLTASQLKQYGIITVNELFQIDDISNIKIIFDLKGKNSIDILLLNFLYTLPSSIINNIYISSFDFEHIRFLSQYRRLNLGLITSNKFLTSQLLIFIKDFNLSFISISYDALTDEVVDLCKRNHTLIFTFTSKNNFDLKYIHNFSVDGVFTDMNLNDII
jgi:glycerophosphoryl diester phosphodiesterase